MKHKHGHLTRNRQIDKFLEHMSNTYCTSVLPMLDNDPRSVGVQEKMIFFNTDLSCLTHFVRMSVGHRHVPNNMSPNHRGVCAL
jgi:hypothetical protein